MYTNMLRDKQAVIKLPKEVMIILTTLLFAHLHAIVLFQTVPYLTRFLPTTAYNIHTSSKPKERKSRAFLACSSALKLSNSFYYGTLCIDSNRDKKWLDHRGPIYLKGEKNIFGFYVTDFQ